MATVIDASVIAAQLLRDEVNSDFARILLEQLDTEERIAPAIFWYEIRNVLLMAKRRNRIDQQQLEACLIQLTDELTLREDTERNDAAILDLAQRHNLTVYDASYLETAIRRKASLATFDRDLANAAFKEKIENPAVELGAVRVG
ncbi:MAG: type II toxin-antitoxin system VapC family toxin [Gemmatimonadota bacterium]|nr:type II toxin-antitoxin system VapC family toxin [Gemmatimonadota bacterium]